jgi:hypothetical protein
MYLERDHTPPQSPPQLDNRVTVVSIEAYRARRAQRAAIGAMVRRNGDLPTSPASARIAA